MIKAILFDFDGTLGDTLPLCMEAFQRAIAPLAGKTLSPEEIVSTFGPSEEGTIKAFIPDQFDEGLHAYWKWYAELHDKYPEPFPGMREVLSLLNENGILVALVTGKAGVSANISLKKYGLLDCFKAKEFGSPKGPRKREAIEAILAEFGLSPDEAAYVGDAPSDVTYAKQAGVAMYAAAWASTADYEELAALGADEVFRTVAEFADFIQRTIIPGATR